MNQIQLSLATVFLVLLSSPRTAVAAEPFDPYAFCQVKLLKVGTDALFQQFMEKGRHVGEIKEVVHNYSLKGRPRVVFISRHIRDYDEVCIMTVVTKEHAQSEGPCPEYELEEVRTTCNE